jgi:hypothetical protein
MLDDLVARDSELRKRRIEFDLDDEAAACGGAVYLL